MTARWGADANVLGWQKADIGGSGTTGATLAAVRSYLIATYLSDGLGPFGKFFDGGAGWHTAYTNFHGSGYGAKANERHPVICAKSHTTTSFNTLMTDMHNALPAGETWYACFFSEPEDDFNSGALTHSAYQAAWASMNTLRAAHPHGGQVKFIPILMAYQEISGSSHWADFLTPVLAVADVIGWDVYDDNGDPQSWSFATDIYPAIQALQTSSGLPWSIPEYGLQVSTHSGSTDNAAGVLSRWEAMVATCNADPHFLWGNYWMDGPHAPNQRSAVIRTSSPSATYLASLVTPSPLPDWVVSDDSPSGVYRGSYLALYHVTTTAAIPADAIWTPPANSTDNRTDSTGMFLDLDLYNGDPGQIGWDDYSNHTGTVRWDRYDRYVTWVGRASDGTATSDGGTTATTGVLIPSGTDVYLVAMQVPDGDTTSLPLDPVTDWSPTSDTGTWTLADGTTPLVPWNNANLVAVPVSYDGPPAAPANDNVGAASDLTGAGGYVDGDVTDASFQAGFDLANSDSGDTPDLTVWYLWTPADSVTATFKVTGGGSGATIDVYETPDGTWASASSVGSGSRTGSGTDLSIAVTGATSYFVRVGCLPGHDPAPFTLAYGIPPAIPADAAVTLPLRWAFDVTIPGYVSTGTDSGDSDQAWAVSLAWGFIVDIEPPWDDTPLIDLTSSA